MSPTTSDRGYVSVVRVSDTILSHIGFFVSSRLACSVGRFILHVESDS